MSRTQGLLSISANFESQSAEPFDARTRVEILSDLTQTSVWESSDSNVYTYVGMIVSVYNDLTLDNNGVYRLKDSDYTDINNWEKLGASEDHNELQGLQGGGGSPDSYYHLDEITYDNVVLVSQDQWDYIVGMNQALATDNDVEFNSLVLAAGTTSKAALKLTSGNLLSSIQSGAFEFDGNSLYFSISSTRYDVLLGGSTTTSIDDLYDVSTIGALEDDLLRYNGLSPGQWVVGSWKMATNPSGAFYPETDDAQDLGKSSNRIRDIYMGSAIDIASGSSLSIKVEGTQIFDINNDGETTIGELGSEVKFRSNSGITEYKNYGENWKSIDQSSDFSKIIYVDAINGNDDARSGRGQTGLPYKTPEAARDAATNGTLIIVNKGDYTITTTDANGLAKDGVDWLINDAYLNKTSAGHMFAMTGYSTGFNVYGSGYLRTEAANSSIFKNDAIAGNFIFECRKADAVSSTTFYLIGGISTHFLSIRVANILSNAGYAVYAQTINQGNYFINANKIESTAGDAIVNRSRGYFTVVANEVISSSGAGISGAPSYGTYALYQVGYCYGSTYGYDFNTSAGAAGNITVIGNTNSIHNIIEGQIKIKGIVGSFISTNGTVTVDQANTCDISGGNVDITIRANSWNSGALISGGIVHLKMVDNYYGKVTVTGGMCYLAGYELLERNMSGSGFFITCNGGKIVQEGDIIWNSTSSTNDDSPIVKLVSGTYVQKGLLYNNLNVGGADCIWKTGGTLVLSGARFRTTESEAQAIAAPSSAQNIKVIWAANSKSNSFVPKVQKEKITVTSIAQPTTIVLNDGSGGNETFTDVTADSKAAIAQRMAGLINASGTLDITASQDIPGTDEYFYIESDVAGTPFSIIGIPVNLTSFTVRTNSYALTNIISGTSIIEDGDIE